MAEKVRLFVAADLPGEIREELAGWAAEAVGSLSSMRVLRPEALHMTLCFLGWVPAGAAAEIGEAAVACVSDVAEMAVEGTVWLPRRRPRLVAVEFTRDDGLAAVQERIVEAMVGVAGHEPEDRPFWPHATVARARGRERERAFDLPGPPALSFRPAALTLYRSHMGSDSARYEPLASVEL